MPLINPENLYYLLAYSLGMRPDKACMHNREPFRNHISVLAHVLSFSMSNVIRKGLIKDYTDHSERTSSPHGRIDIQKSVSSGTLQYNKVVCSFQEFDSMTLENGFIASVVSRMLSSSVLDGKTHDELVFVDRALSMIPKFSADVQTIRRLSYKGHDRDYITSLYVSSLFIEGMIMNTQDGSFISSFMSEDKEFALFEKFVRGYYYVEHRALFDSKRKMEWAVTDESGRGSLPDMEVDLMLSSGNRSLIIDTKCYTHSMSERYGKRTFHSFNLYQICNYVENLKYTSGRTVSGMLLYAKTDKELIEESHEIRGNMIHVRELDLNIKWGLIVEQMNYLISII